MPVAHVFAGGCRNRARPRETDGRGMVVRWLLQQGNAGAVLIVGVRYISELSGGKLTHSMDHLACFWPGTLALAAMSLKVQPGRGVILQPKPLLYLIEGCCCHQRRRRRRRCSAPRPRAGARLLVATQNPHFVNPKPLTLSTLNLFLCHPCSAWPARALTSRSSPP